MIRITPLLLAAAIASLSACGNKPQAPNNMATEDVNMTGPGDMNAVNGAGATQVDANFVTSSIKGDTAEIAIAELAQKKGSTPAARDLGKMLAADHGAHKQKLIDLANSAGIPVPTEPADEGHANLLKLQKLSGAEFDKTLAQMLIDSHHKGIAKNEAQAKSGDPQTAALANETLPVLKKHLAAAEALQK